MAPQRLQGLEMVRPTRRRRRRAQPRGGGLLAPRPAVVHQLLPLHAHLRVYPRLGRHRADRVRYHLVGGRDRVARARGAELHRLLRGCLLLRGVHRDVDRPWRHRAGEQLGAGSRRLRDDHQSDVRRETVRGPQLHHLHPQPLARTAAPAVDADRGGLGQHGGADGAPEAGLGVPGLCLGGAEGEAREGELARLVGLPPGGAADDRLPEARVPRALLAPVVRRGAPAHPQLVDGRGVLALRLHYSSRRGRGGVVLHEGGHGGHLPHRGGAQVARHGSQGPQQRRLLRRGGPDDGAEAHLLGHGAVLLRVFHVAEERDRRGHGPRP
mmetsp:Transcript_91033/g.254330  ORF Transcript_91033/g.254330 Transcript_91033/m.254330 type:complete len:325 (-) Transcript_91033:1082-2056(-)